MNNLFKRFFLSFHPDFFSRSVREDSWVMSWIFWFFWHIVLISILGGIFFFTILPYTSLKNSDIQELLSTIPEFNFEIQDGQLITTGLEEPFVFTLNQ